MTSEKKAPCGKAPSCEECPFPDCTWDGVSPEDWAAAKERDAQARRAAGNRKAAQNRAYYIANREKIAAKSKAYYAATREKVAAYDRLIEHLVAWRDQEKGLSRAVLDDVLELNLQVKREVSA